MQDKVILVTGAFGALGQAVVKELSNRGAKVVAIDVAPEGEAEGAVLALAGVDITDPAATARAVARSVERVGPLDGLVNVAGGFTWETVLDGSVDSWDAMYRINVRTAMLMSQAVARELSGRGGAIVNIGAGASAKAAMGMGAYAASKAGVARLTEALAEELKDSGVRVNAVLPSIIDTARNREDMPDAQFDRWVAPSALATVVAFLLSDDAAAITGALLPVNGRV
ncbi:NAD(P)-dependent dehydrogenase (short-subunit alcohol dehydrogenase family) [Novosphingobium hassiacum]|uniref:NAD(P)-dependent dehydrogenase (Short-subunit alcohol dehydrogenase family) n=1 Tax=Novosphingobium hassiacum TaxID=173676 RepID=A0A7W6EW80_9SPHN|nr:SDR family NAD(P)-dependent oxidoreductase [Novosphingobium hassiacum]MBB3860956.1 NAD(P)-dependent dehydrogenase (short-subunit alcohol dehydrogenase family) [Novosphingobium hassiacum]